MTDHSALIERLEANEPLPICPYDRRSPEYWTTNDTDPCKFCGTKNEEGAPDLCRGADTRLFAEAAAALRDQQAVMQMAAERLSVHAQVRSKASGETYLRSSMAGIAGDLFAALRPLPSAPNQAKEAGE